LADERVDHQFHGRSQRNPYRLEHSRLGE
jgi:hypothetical protein